MFSSPVGLLSPILGAAIRRETVGYPLCAPRAAVLNNTPPSQEQYQENVNELMLKNMEYQSKALKQISRDTGCLLAWFVAGPIVAGILFALFGT